MGRIWEVKCNAFSKKFKGEIEINIFLKTVYNSNLVTLFRQKQCQKDYTTEKELNPFLSVHRILLVFYWALIPIPALHNNFKPANSSFKMNYISLEHVQWVFPGSAALIMKSSRQRR